ncbi:MAG: GMC family oxidoreductase [Nevskiales bacterium]
MSSYDYDYLIIGSGFGGSVSALRLTEKGYRVAVMEMGQRWTPENLPTSNWQIWKYLWKPRLGWHGFFSLRKFRHVMVVHGNAVGGGSIAYANTLLVPPDKVWSDGTWAGLDDWTRVMPQHYATAKRMLGVTRNRILGPADLALKKVAEECGVGDSFYATDVGVFFGDENQPRGQLYQDPYFGGEGPDRNSCIGCGACMVGCRHNAKNTLDKNYLYLAEKKGAQVFAQTKVVDVKPLNGREDGVDGYEVTTTRATSLIGAGRRRFTAGAVIFAASSLGTQELLFRLKDRGSLPNISDQLGQRVRTNAESFIGVRMPDTTENMSEGIAIGSGVYLDEHTHIETVRYPDGSDLNGTIVTVLTHGQPGATRILLWLWTLLRLFLQNPLRLMRVLWPVGFARQTITFLVMQTVDGFLTMRWRRPWFWPFAKLMQTEGDAIPAFIPQANEFALKAAQSLHGVALSMITEILFNIPTTAHCMGGCGMGDSPERGVIDAHNRVFGYRNLYICDGSMLGANLGVNPSLTITALTERAMSFIPPASSAV